MGQALPNGFKLYLPLVKVDKEKRLVTGVATSEMRDSDGEIIEYEASKRAFADWVGNIREMHDPTKAVGKRVEVIPDDKEKKIYVTSYISEGAQDTWAKILDGTLAGYSVGGRVILKEVDKADPTTKRIKEFSMSELSVVDAPANPECSMGLVKAVGGVLRFVEDGVENTLLEQVRKFTERRKRHMEKDALKKADKAAEEAAAEQEKKDGEEMKDEAKKADEAAAEGGSVEDRLGKLEAGLAALTEAVKTLIATDEQAHEDMEGEEQAEGEAADGDEEKEDAEKEDSKKADKAAGGSDDLKKSVSALEKQNANLVKAIGKLTEDLKKYASRPAQRKFVPEKKFASDQAEDMSKADKAEAKKAEEVPAEIQAIVEKCKAGTATPSEIKKRDAYLAERMGRKFGA